MARIILSADRTLTADYRILLEGMLGTAITDTTPKWIYEHFIARKPALDKNGELAYPPYSLRKIQSSLLSAGFDREDVVIVPPNKISSFVNNETRIVGVSSGDPLGMGMTSTTIRYLFGGRPYTEIYFSSLSKDICELKSKIGNIKFCYGGPGAWQFEKKPEAAISLGIDHVFIGYSEKTVPTAFRRIINGEKLPLFIPCEEPSSDNIKPMTAPSSMGVVEISRGCGRGCKFCTVKDKRMIHIPTDSIVQEIEKNVKEGAENVCLLSEDFLRYGSEGIKVEKEKVKSLFAKVAQIKGIGLIQLDHINISSVAQLDAPSLRELHDIISVGKNNDWIWVNAGIETASTSLLSKIAPGKASPFSIESWPEITENAIGNLNDAGFFPFLSVMVGAPFETDADVQETLDFLERIKGERAALFPVLYVGVDNESSSFSMEDMTELQWELFRKANETNFKWLPKLYAENQKAGNIPFIRRILTQLIGRLGIITARRRIGKLSAAKRIARE